jgi:hypothetical protein
MCQDIRLELKVYMELQSQHISHPTPINYQTTSNRRRISNSPLLRRILTDIILHRLMLHMLINIITAQLLKRLPLRLGNTKRSEDPQEHEQRIDLHNVSLVRVRHGFGSSAFGAQFGDPGLSDDGADFAHSGAEAVGGGAVAGGETFAGDDEGRCVRSYCIS